MALNVTQVNQAFLGLLGRPATGAEAAKFAGQLDAATLAQTLLTDASFKTQLSLEAPSFKTVDLLNTDPAAFVESLYTALLGRASDAEGKAFWLSVAGATPNRADVVSQFIAAVQAQEGTADANAFASIQAEDKALASAWVESLYNNLAGRASDAEGLDFWTNAIVSFTMTPAQVAASFAAALALQGNTTEDGQNYLAKQGVADNFTANFKDFSTLITANEKTEALKNLVTMMNGVTKDSDLEQYTQEITKTTAEFKDIKAIQFTTSEEDNLGVDPETGEPNTTSGVNFTGTYNLTDPEKGTIQQSDSATGNPDYLTDTLTVNVIGYDKTTHADFDLGELPSTTNVEKLIINNGAANVSGSISGDFEYINVNGTGSFEINASNADGFKDIVLNSATDKDGLNTFSTNDNVRSIKTGAGNDTLNLGTVTKSLSTGAGDDTVTASLAKGATADLGAGNDTFKGSLNEAAKLSAGAGNDELTIYTVNYREDKKGNPIAEVEIDGGTGEDTLDLSLVSNGNLISNGDGQGIKSIKGIENLKVGVATKLMASAVSGQKLELSGTSLELNASGASTVDLTKFTNADGNNVAVTINNVKSGTINLATSTKEFNAISETIVLDKDASGVSIKGFEKANDKISIAGAVNSGENLFVKDAQGDVIAFTANLKADYIYKVDLKDPMTLKALKDLKDTGLSEKDVFYVIATDELNGKNSNANVYKVEVGKNGTVGKTDKIATINVANKEVLDAGKNQDIKTSAELLKETPVTSVQDAKDIASNLSVTGAQQDIVLDLSNLTAKELKELTSAPLTIKAAQGQDLSNANVSFIAPTGTNLNLKVESPIASLTTGNSDDTVDVSALSNATDVLIDLGGSSKAGNTLILGNKDLSEVIKDIKADNLTIQGTTGAKLSAAALESFKDEKGSYDFNLSGDLTIVTPDGTVLDASAVTPTGTSLTFDATTNADVDTLIGALDKDGKTSFVSAIVKDATLSTITDIKDIKVADKGTLTLSQETFANLGKTTIAKDTGASNTTLAITGIDGTSKFAVSNTTVSDIDNINLKVLSGVNAAISSYASANTTVELGNNGEVGKKASFTEVDTIVLKGTNAFDAKVLGDFASGSGALTTSKEGDKATVTTNADLDLTHLSGNAVIDITTTASTAAISGSANTIENVYLGDDKSSTTWASADLTKYDANVDAIYATATKLKFADVSKFNSKKLDLGKASADITITEVGAGSGDLTALFDNATSDDKIALTLASGVTSVTLTDAAETVDATAVAITNATPLNLSTMFVDVAANDAIKAKVGVNTAGQTAEIILSAAKDTVDVSAAKGSGGALTITATSFDKATDKISFASTATKGELTKTTITAVDTDIKSITVTNGVLTLGGDAGNITGEKLTIANALTALSKDEAKGALLNKVLFFTDNAGVNYLITEGASTATTDDVAIKLTGVTTTGFSIDNGVVTLA